MQNEIDTEIKESMNKIRDLQNAQAHFFLDDRNDEVFKILGREINNESQNLLRLLGEAKDSQGRA